MCKGSATYCSGGSPDGPRYVPLSNEEGDDGGNEEEKGGDDDDASDDRHILVVISRQRANFRSVSLFSMDGRFCESVHVLGIIHSLGQHLSGGVSNDLDHYILRRLMQSLIQQEASYISVA